MLRRAMHAQALSIAVDVPGIDAVPALFEEPAPDPCRSAVAVLFAHGSNFGKDSPWTRTLVQALVRHGFSVLSFDYAYRARGGSEATVVGDSLAQLEHVHGRALAELERRCGGQRIVLAGKSLGARLSTLLAAKGERCHGLALFGYPLHGPRSTRLHSEHFSALVQPTLFLQGSRDPFCVPSRLEGEIPRHGGGVTLRVIEDADHAFRLPHESEAEVPSLLGELARQTAAWRDTTWPI